MRVFITGATGYVGSAALDALVRAGHDVTALVRGLSSAGAIVARGARAVAGDLGSPDSYREAARGFDAYVHTAFEHSARAVEVDASAVATLGMLAGESRGVFVYTSGIWVLGDTEGPADEGAPLRPTALVAFRPAHEAAALQVGGNGARAIVVRPGIVYGGGRGIISDMLKDAENGLMRVIGSGKNHWPHVYDRDLADLYVRLLAAPGAAGVYHATDEADETVNDVVEAIAGHAPSRPDVRYMPMSEAQRKLGAYADALALDQVVRSPRARALGWQPTLGAVARNVPRLFEEWRNARNARAARA
jgi:nucleoside-diphosphate-sugar epimerase